MKNSRIKLSSVVFSFIIFLALLSGYLGHSDLLHFGSIQNICIIVIFICALFFSYRHGIDRKLFFKIIYGGIIFIFFLSLNYIMGTNRGFIWYNIRLLLRIFILVICLVIFFNDEKLNFLRKLQKCFWIFNIFGLMNMIVVTIQVNVKGFLMPSQWLTINPYYPDLCAGLFGYNGTHRLAFFMTFLFLYNLYIAEYKMKNNRRIRLQIFNIVLLLWDFVLANFNENKTLYVFTVISLAIYICLDNFWNKKLSFASLKKWLKYIIAGLILVGVLFCFTDTREFIVDRLFSTFIELQNTNAVKGITRLRVILIAFEQGFGYGFGKGLGYYTIISSGVESNTAFVGIRNFGEFNMASMIYLMGIWFYLFYIVWISKLYQNMIKGKDKMFFSVILFIMLFLTFYSLPLTDITLAIYVTFIFSVFCMMKESIKYKKEIRV